MIQDVLCEVDESRKAYYASIDAAECSEAEDFCRVVAVFRHQISAAIAIASSASKMEEDCTYDIAE